MQDLTNVIDGLCEKYSKQTAPFGILGYVVYKRTYARFIPELNRTEEWHETIARKLKGALHIGTPYGQHELEVLFDAMFNLKCLFAGRHIWQLGTKTVDKIGMDSLNNCWTFPLNDWFSYCKAFNELMLGGGVGYSVEKQFIHQLPVVKEVKYVKENISMSKKEILDNYVDNKDDTVKIEKSGRNYVFVGDSRQGWVDLLNEVLKSFFETGESFYFNTKLIRKKGEPIKGFGGKASGDGELVKGILQIVDILQSASGKKLESHQASDIMCIIASIVVSGNVRRSALIAVGDRDDEYFLKYKRWDTGNIPSYRAMVNITIKTSTTHDLSQLFWDSYTKAGEPIGLLNRKKGINFGRTNDKSRDLDSYLPNPCAEHLGLNESCNLSEIFLSRCKDIEEACLLSKFLYIYNKTVSQGKYIYKDVQKKINKNGKIGIGLTGILEKPERISWCDKIYNELKEFDSLFSVPYGYSPSKKLTVVKPSGTLSLLAGVTPGVHPAYAKYYYRTVRFASNDQLVKLCKRHGCKTELAITRTGTDENGNPIIEYDKNTTVIYFPIKTDDGTLTRHDVSAIQQLDYVKKIQEVWADQAVSVTVYYNKDNFEEIKEYLNENWENNFKTVSFLQDIHGFVQAPLIEIEEEEYNKAMKNFRPINSMEGLKDVEMELEGGVECEGGVCPVR